MLDLQGAFVAVVLGLVWAFYWHVEILGLRFGELGEDDADFLQVQAGDFFVELLWEAIDFGFAGVFVGP